MIQIHPIQVWELNEEARLACYQNRFVATTLHDLAHCDVFSEHFEVRQERMLLGGFRLTAIQGHSEVERLFTAHRFAAGSSELGRVWAAKGRVRTVFKEVFSYLSDSRARVYFKTSDRIGKMTEFLASRNLGLEIHNPILSYQCKLYSYGIDAKSFAESA